MNHEDLKGHQPKALPKSLHTIRILASIAYKLIQHNAVSRDPALAVLAAVRVCGYGDCTPDPYGLRGKATVMLTKIQADSAKAAA